MGQIEKIICYLNPMKQRKWILALLFVFLIGGEVNAQQDAMYSQYMFNGLVLNPAYAGSRNSLSVTALLRRQWVSIPGAPQTETISAHGNSRNDRFGFGASIINDRISFISQTWYNGHYAFRIPMRKGTLALGLQGSLYNFRVNWEEAYTIDPNDDVVVAFSRNLLLPNVGFGMYYATDRAYIGASMPHMLIHSLNRGRPKVSFFDIGDDLPGLYQHSFLTAGYVVDVNENIKFKPSLLVKYHRTAPIQFDLNATLLWYDRLWTGVSYRTRDGFVAMVEYQFNSMIRAGYAYDYPFTQLNRFTSGSHEIMLGFDLNFKNDPAVSPRFF